MRFLAASLGAVLITVVVFLFMQGLIAGRQQAEVQQVVPQSVEIVQAQPEPEPEQPEEQQDEALKPEPMLDQLQLAPRAPQPAATVAAPDLEVASSNMPLVSGGGDWHAPLGGAAGQVIDGQAADGQGFVEVVPFSTRKPNVPELAWRNKISGWVLVAFNVSPEGRTSNARVLDASPRGVFEEKVIAAVEDWSYTVKFKGQPSAKLVVTQRVEVNWQDFPMNIPNVD